MSTAVNNNNNNNERDVSVHICCSLFLQTEGRMDPKRIHPKPLIITTVEPAFSETRLDKKNTHVHLFGRFHCIVWCSMLPGWRNGM